MESYPILQTPQPVIRETFGCSLYPRLGASEISFSPSLGDMIDVTEAISGPNLTITLPERLAEDAGFSGTPPSLSFCGYKTEALFVRRGSYLEESGRGDLELNSGVVSARLAVTERVTDLSKHVKIMFVKNQVGLCISC